MKERTDNYDPRLSEVLRAWQVCGPLPPRFQERVWKRIEAAEARPLTTGWSDRFAVAFARPAFAMVCAALMLLAGLSAGLWRANRATEHWDSELAQRYVSAVNPDLGRH